MKSKLERDWQEAEIEAFFQKDTQSEFNLFINTSGKNMYIRGDYAKN